MLNKYCAATPSVGNLGDTVTFKAKGKTYTVKIVDRLGSSYGNKIDLFIPNHSNCYKFGVQYGTLQLKFTDKHFIHKGRETSPKYAGVAEQADASDFYVTLLLLKRSNYDFS